MRCTGDIRTGWLAQLLTLFKENGVNIRQMAMVKPFGSAQPDEAWLDIQFELGTDARHRQEFLAQLERLSQIPDTASSNGFLSVRTQVS